MSLIAAIYARKSQDQMGLSEDTKSVARQIERAKAFAAQRGWLVSEEHIFVDDGASGAEFDREGLLRLLGALKPKPPFDVLVVMNKDRLGREQYESAYHLKRLAQAGVRVFEYLEGRECLLDTPTEKFVEMVGCFAAEQERFQASRRTRDALARKAEQGYVTGGVVFGYRNEPVFGAGLDADGQPKRQHVVRKVNADEAVIVRRIFTMVAKGMGFKKIAKTLNDEGVMAPRPRRDGRPRSWSPSSVRGVVFNPLYIGRVVWGRVKKRDSWGLKKYLRRPKDDWHIRQDPTLQIAPNDLWEAAHARIAATRATYRNDSDDPRGGRPTIGTESKYLLSGFIQCGICGGGMYVWSRDFRRYRRHIYVCGYHHDRGSAVCPNGLPMPMDAADAAVMKAIEQDLMRSEVIDAALEEAIQAMRSSNGEAAVEQRKIVQAELAAIEGELEHYAKAIAKAGPLESLLGEVDQREKRRAVLRRQLSDFGNSQKVTSVDTARIKADLRDRVTDWQGLLRRQTPEAREILRSLLVGRLVFTPKEDEKGRYYEFQGEGSISRILGGIVSTDRIESRRGHHHGWYAR